MPENQELPFNDLQASPLSKNIILLLLLMAGQVKNVESFNNRVDITFAETVDVDLVVSAIQEVGLESAQSVEVKDANSIALILS